MPLADRVGRAVDAVADRTGPLVADRPGVRTALRRVRRALPRRGPDEGDPVAQVLYEFGRAHPRAFFVQVGTNDGDGFDPLRAELRARDWRGIMVEPVPYVFERLVARHGWDRRLVLENVAIAEADGTRPFHHLQQAEDGADLPEWYDKLGSFRLEVVEKHRPAIPDFDRRLVTVEVPCLTFDALCRRHGVDHVDLVHLDTEGYDFEIVKLVDLDRLRPRLVVYEHLHLDPSDQDLCRARLEAHGYELRAGVVDTIALRTADLTNRERDLATCFRTLPDGPGSA